MVSKIRVLIADDHTIVRSGVHLLLEAEADIEVVGEALNGLEAIEQAEKLQPDVILMDVSMPKMDGLEATRQVKARWPDINVLVLTMHRSEEYFFEALNSGASGYILKAADTDELVNAVRVVGHGEVFLYPSMAKKLLEDYLRRQDPASKVEMQLSEREREIMRMLVDGYSNKEIADTLVVSLSTVHTHRGNLMKKLGLNSQHELVQYARQHGLLS